MTLRTNLMAEKQIIYAAVNTNEMDKRVVVCKDKEEFPVVVTLQDNIFLETAKELVLAKLQGMYRVFDNAKAGDLTFYKEYSENEGFAEVIEEEEPTFPRKFYASLIIPEAKEEESGMV